MPDAIPESLRSRLSYLLGSLYRRSLQLETEALEQLGIGIKQQAALDVLAEEGPLSQRELGYRLGIDRTTIVAIVDDLQDAGLITRVRNPADRRSHLVTMSPLGKRTQQRGRRAVRRAERSTLSALPAAERGRLTTLLAEALPPRTP